MIRTAWTLLFVFCALACVEHANVVGPRDVYDYSIEQKLECFCPGPTVPVRVFVSDDTIARVEAVQTRSLLPYSSWGQYRTITGLFAEARRWDTAAFDIHVVLDTANGYPSVVAVTPRTFIINDTTVDIPVDGGFTYYTSGLVRYR